jgi:nucleoside-diphosphate-sugar epimerase
MDPYQKTKLAAEKVLLDEMVVHDLPAVILRPGAFYGPYGRYGFNRLFIEDPLRGLRIGVGRGKLFTFPVYVDDIVQAILLAQDRGKPGEIYNICADPVTHQTVHNLVSELAGIPASRWNAPRVLMLSLAWAMEQMALLTGREPFYPLNLQHYVFKNWVVDSQKARRELRFQPTPLREGLAKTIAWYKSLDN